MKRRSFLKRAAAGAAGLVLAPFGLSGVAPDTELVEVDKFACPCCCGLEPISSYTVTLSGFEPCGEWETVAIECP